MKERWKFNRLTNTPRISRSQPTTVPSIAFSLAALLAAENYHKAVADGEQGWTLQADTVIVWEKADAFGRTSLKGEIPDFLYDDTSSIGDTFVLWRKQTEEFLGTRIGPSGFRWPWQR